MISKGMSKIVGNHLQLTKVSLFENIQHQFFLLKKYSRALSRNTLLHISTEDDEPREHPKGMVTDEQQQRNTEKYLG